MTSIADQERTAGVPLGQRSGARVAAAAVGYLAVAAAVAFYLLPVGFGLTSGTLLLAQVLVLLAARRWSPMRRS